MPATLVERLRESVRACRAIDRSQLLEEAADEIERLRNNAAAYTDGISASCKSKTLTDAEQKAITEASDFYVGTRTGVTLRNLLERLG